MQLENLPFFFNNKHLNFTSCLSINLCCYGNSFGCTLQVTKILNPAKMSNITKALDSTYLWPVWHAHVLLAVYVYVSTNFD